MKIACVRPDELGQDQLDAWRRLQSGAYDHPFFAPEYTQIVSEVRDQVRVAVIENDDSCAFFPFEQGASGIGLPVGSRLTDYQGPIVQDIDLDVRQLLRSCGLRAWQFDHLLPNCPALQPYIDGTAGSPYLDLTDGFEAYRKSRQQAGSSAIKQFERKSRKLAREVGPLRFEMHSTDRQAFNTLIQWKRDYIRQKAAFPLMDTQWALGLLERIWQTETPGLTGRLSALYAGDELIAVHLGLCNQTVCHWWVPTYDVRYQQYSPGAILLLSLADAVAKAGMTRLDLGKGDESYKQRMMSGEVQLGEGTLTRSPMQRLLGRAWHHSRSKLRSSGLQPIIKKSKEVIRYGPWLRRSSNDSPSDR